jgi:cytochrome P450
VAGAVDDLLRAYGATTTRRYLTRDLEFHGVQMKKGDRVLMPTYISGRDALSES